jgi:hypothetical protein
LVDRSAAWLEDDKGLYRYTGILLNALDAVMKQEFSKKFT